MTGDTEPTRRLTSRDLDLLHGRLGGRDLAIINHVSDLRLMSARQITSVHFTLSEHDNPVAAARASQRALARLVRDQLLVRLARRVGGVRAGSAGYIYGLGPAGQRILFPDAPRRRDHEPGLGFVDHTLAVAQLVVDLIETSRTGPLEILGCQTEPRCHRTFTGIGGLTEVKPDLFIALGVGDLEHRWFVEIDRANASLPVVLRKCRTYDAYYHSGKEQTAHGVFPKVCWVVPDHDRADRIATPDRS